jgi:hypothetical protein
MNIITKLKQENEHYLFDFAAALTHKVNILRLDHSRGETDWTRILFLDKKNLNFNQAMSILLLRLMMYEEEWTDFEAYNLTDIERWIGFLETQYSANKFVENTKSTLFFVERAKQENETKSFEFNAQIIDYQHFIQLNPLQNAPILSISNSIFQSLREEYYIETAEHFVLFSWYTTA